MIEPLDNNYQSIPIELSAIDWIITALDLDQLGYEDKTLDVIYDKIDDLMTAGRFFEVDQILRLMKFLNCTINFSIGILTVTFHGKKHLLNRTEYYKQFKQELQGHADADALLMGLE